MPAGTLDGNKGGAMEGSLRRVGVVGRDDAVSGPRNVTVSA